MHPYIHISRHIYIHLHPNTHIHIYIHTYMHTHVSIYRLLTHTHTSIHTYTYTHTSIHTHTHNHASIHKGTQVHTCQQSRGHEGEEQTSNATRKILDQDQVTKSSEPQELSVEKEPEPFPRSTEAILVGTAFRRLYFLRFRDSTPSAHTFKTHGFPARQVFADVPESTVI